MFYFIHLKHFKSSMHCLRHSGQQFVKTCKIFRFTVIKRLTMIFPSELHSFSKIFVNWNLIFNTIKMYYLCTNLTKHSLAKFLFVSESKIIAKTIFFSRVIYYVETRSEEHSLTATFVSNKFLSRSIRYLDCRCMFNTFCFKKFS